MSLINSIVVISSLASCFAQTPHLYRQKATSKSSSFTPAKLLPQDDNDANEEVADAQTDESGFGGENIGGFGELGGGGGGLGNGGGGGGGKFFMYAHNPVDDHYEFGFKRGNEHHFTERHEKAHPHEGQFKTHARWGDKHGGYGEHYWDYNHGDNHQGEENDGAGDESQVIPEVTQAAPKYQTTEENSFYTPKYSSKTKDHGKLKRQHNKLNNKKEMTRNIAYIDRTNEGMRFKKRPSLAFDEGFDDQ